MVDEKFTTPCDLPTDYERELLDISIEECAEVIQRATKMLRFGRDEVQPGQPYSNRDRLSLEVGDLSHMLNLLLNTKLLSAAMVEEGRRNKAAQLAKFMQTKPPASAQI